MAEKTIEIQTTLVRYNNPVLVIKHEDKKGKEEVVIEVFCGLVFLIWNLTFLFKDATRPTSGATAGTIGDSRKETEEILNSILPPRCWVCIF